MHNKSVAIIGAGLSGSVCAKTLKGFVKNITVFERESVVGGRLYFDENLSTTPDFTISTPFFQQIVNRWMSDGLVSEQTGLNVEISGSEMHNQSADQQEFKITDTTLNLVDHLLTDIPIRLNTDISDIERSNNHWRLFDIEGAYLGAFDSVIVTTSINVAELLKPSKVLFKSVQAIQYSSVWSVLLTSENELSLPFDKATFIDSPLASCFVLKPNKVILYATPEWSDTYAALPAEQVSVQLKQVFEASPQFEVENIIDAKATYWAKHLPVNTLSEDCLFDETLGLGVCGDWCTSPRVEGAVLSGFSVADRVMNYFS